MSLDNVLTVASEYGVIKAENIRNIYGSRGDDIMIGNENFQDFRGDGGYDTYIGGVGEDNFRVESQYANDGVLIDNFIRITDFESVDKISIEDYGFSLDNSIAANQFNVRQDFDKNETYISVDTDDHSIEDIFTIEGIFYLSSFYTETESGSGDTNLKIRLDGSSNPNNYNYITGTDRAKL